MRTFKYYKKYIPLILLAFVLLIAQAYCDLALPEYMTKIVSEGIVGNSVSSIWKYGVIMLAYSLGVTAASILVGYIAAYVGSGASRDMRKDIFVRVSNFSNAEFDKFTVSSLITRSTNDITQVQMFAIMVIRMVLYAPVMAVGGIIKAIKMSSGVSSLAIVIIIAVAAMILGIGIIMLIVQPKVMRLQKLIDKLNLVAREGLNGMLVVRAFNTQSYEEQRFDDVNKKLTGTNLFVNRIMSFMMPLMMLIMNGVSIAVIWIVAKTAGNANDVANMMAFIQYAMQIIMSFMMLTIVLILMPRALVSARRISEVIKQQPSVQSSADASAAGELRGEVRFENVSFAYGEGSDNAIEDISFTASPGTTTAIIGSTGSGKSTLVSLIPRLYDVGSGKVTVDGKDVRDFTLESLRDNVAFVPQKNVLFSGTIKSNIKYADETGSDERMTDAAETAQATEIVSAKSAGYDSEISQGGTNVSGGQKQRLAIARALYKKAPIYVFDDSFSALDFKTDAALRKALKDKVSDATVIIVAQRVGSIMNADNILVMNEGRIVGQGTHKQLMESCGVYADIASSQLSPEELAGGGHDTASPEEIARGKSVSDLSGKKDKKGKNGGNGSTVKGGQEA